MSHVRVFLCMHVYMCVATYDTCVRLCVCVYVCVSVYVRACSAMLSRVHVRLHLQTCMHICVCVATVYVTRNLMKSDEFRGNSVQILCGFRKASVQLTAELQYYFCRESPISAE